MARKPRSAEPVRGLFRRSDSGYWWCRVRAPGREPRQRSTGAPLDDVQRANDVMAMLDTLERQQQFDLLDAAWNGKLSLTELYARYITNQLAEARSTASDVDLSSLVDKWERHMTRTQHPSPKQIDTYVREVRTLIAEGERFPASKLTRATGNEWLSSLADDGLSPSTRRRYGAAMKVFAGWALEDGAFPVNPLRDWKLPANNKARQVWWTWETLTKALTAMPDGEPGSRAEQEKLCVTLMAGSGMELSAALVVSAKDVNRQLHTVFAHGTKNPWRSRNCHVRKWAWSILEPHARTFLHGAPLFPLVNADTLRDHFYDAQVSIGLGTKTYDAERRHTDYAVEHTLHDLRHTFCFLAFTGEDGDEKKGLHYCKRQLGHKDLVMSQRIYANFNLENTAPVEDADESPLAQTGT